MHEPERTQPGEGPLPPLPPLSAEEMRTLAYASAIGSEFDFPLLVASMGAHEETLAELLERLVHARLLRERPGGDRFAFVQDELRARLYQSLTASRLRVLHKKIAEALERLHPDPPEELLAELGRHYFLGKVPERSYDYNRRAATVAVAHGQPEEAAHQLERARIDLKTLPGDHTTELVEIGATLGDLYYATGDVRLADRLYEEAISLVPPKAHRQRARLLLARAEVARETLNGDAARRAAHEAHELFSREGDLVGVASVHRILGRIAFHQGAYREALDEAILALDLLQQSGDSRTLGRLCVDLGNAFAMLGPEVEAEGIVWYERAIDRLTEAGDYAEVARAYLNLASLVGQTRPSAGLEHLAKGQEAADRAHEPRWSGWGLAMGVEMRLQLGEVEEAERDNQQARRLLERANDALGLQQVEANAGLIAEKRGQWEDGEIAYRSALEQAERLRLSAEAAQANFYLARLLYKTRNLTAARAAYARALEADLPTLNPPSAKAFRELGELLREGVPDPARANAPSAAGPARPS